MELDKIKVYYSKMDIDKLERIAKFEIASLRPEVINIVKEEIHKRGMDKNLLDGIQSQVIMLSPSEILEATEKIKSLKCPNCGDKKNNLVGGNLRKVRGYVFFTFDTKQEVILCGDCLNKSQNDALLKNILFGWWGFPRGLIATPRAIIGHFKEQKRDKARGVSEVILKDFVLENIGELRTNWDNEEELIHFIQYKNELVD